MGDSKTLPQLRLPPPAFLGELPVQSGVGSTEESHLSLNRYCFYNSGVGWGHWDSCNFLSSCSLANFVSILGLFFF